MHANTNISLNMERMDDELRGLFRPSDMGRVILPFVVMRRLDCVLGTKKDEVCDLFNKYKDQISRSFSGNFKPDRTTFFNTSRFDLVRIKSDPNNVLANFNNYINGYSKNVFDIIKNFSINPLVEKLNEHGRLYQLIDKLTEFDLHPNAIDNHKMGKLIMRSYCVVFQKCQMRKVEIISLSRYRKITSIICVRWDEENLKGEGLIRSVFDPCCGTGGMLLLLEKIGFTVNINSNLKIDLYGQELNDVTYAICKSDLLMMDENAENIHGPCSSLSEDQLRDKKFDYMITNPPFGVSWKSDADYVKAESNDTKGRFHAGLPRTS